MSSELELFFLNAFWSCLIPTSPYILVTMILSDNDILFVYIRRDCYDTWKLSLSLFFLTYWLVSKDDGACAMKAVYMLISLQVKTQRTKDQCFEFCSFASDCTFTQSCLFKDTVFFVSPWKECGMDQLADPTSPSRHFASLPPLLSHLC